MVRRSGSTELWGGFWTPSWRNIPQSWDQLLGALTFAFNSRPHRRTGVAPLDLVSPMAVESWSFKDIPTRSSYPLASQAGTGTEKRTQSALLLRLTTLVPQIEVALKVTQNRYKW